MAKRFRKGPALTRRTAKRDPKLKLVIVCEGENTEPKYLKDFANDHANPLVEIEIVGANLCVRPKIRYNSMIKFFKP